MASRSVDVVAIGPPPLDPYAPAATAWAIARALADAGDRVRVLYPEGSPGIPPPTGVEGTPVALPLRRPGAAVEPAEFASLAGRRVRPDATWVVRDPSGLGPLGVGGRRGGGPFLVSFVRAVELHAFDRERAGRTPAGFGDRLDTWRDRRAVRRLERSALAEPAALFSDDPELTRAVASEYGLDPRLLRPTVPPVAVLPPAPARAAARGALGIPPDVPVVLAPSSSEEAGPAGVDRVRESFRRIRALFPGVRLVIVGAPAPVEPGVVDAPARDAATLSLAVACADVAVVAPTRAGFDPGAIHAMRAGLATIVGSGARFPLPPGDAVRPGASDDPGDLASVLAELIADPAARRELGNRGREYAEAYRPEKVVEQIAAVARSRGA
jgi:glycosyltransferase involved in cell wall biosynthesis